MNKKAFARLVFACYLVFIVAAFYFGKDRLVMLAMAFLAGLGYLWRVMYVEDSEKIIMFFDGRIKEVVESIVLAISETNKRIDKHHPPENEKQHD